MTGIQEGWCLVQTRGWLKPFLLPVLRHTQQLPSSPGEEEALTDCHPTHSVKPYQAPPCLGTGTLEAWERAAFSTLHVMGSDHPRDPPLT